NPAEHIQSQRVPPHVSNRLDSSFCLLTFNIIGCVIIAGKCDFGESHRPIANVNVIDAGGDWCNNVLVLSAIK
ncbi:MAG: hypothetical protein Q7U37_01885, partial [Gallionella sp.]|nr:hypothetical protein [Gallionella sp.]